MNTLTPFDAPPEQIHGATGAKDAAYWSTIDEILKETPHSTFHLLNLWPAYVRRISIVRFLNHHELFKKVIGIPGSIIEVGTSRGVSFFTWMKFLEIYCPADTARKVIGFDSFEGLTDFTPEDGILKNDADKIRGGWSAGSVESEVFKLLEAHNADSILAKQRGQLIKGRVQDTLKPFISNNPGLRISLLHLDLDLYEPTLHVLENLWDLVLPSGLIVFDEFALPPWEGETRAWETFAKSRNISALRINRLDAPGCLTPTGYIVKPYI